MSTEVSRRCWVRAVVAVLATACGASARAADVGPRMDIRSYRTELNVLFDDQSVEGTTTIVVRAGARGMREIVFNANALTVDTVTVDARPAQSSIGSGGLTVALPRPLRHMALTTVRITYHGAPARGLVFSGRSVVASYFTCDWMICSLEPFGEKAPFELDLHVPRGMMAWGPGRLESKRALDDSEELQVWREPRPYSAYLFGFALGDFNQLTERIDHTDLVYLSAIAGQERLRHLFAPTADMLRFFADKAGVPFPHGRYAQVLTAGADAQEAANYSVLGDEVVAPLLDDPQEDWAIAHELAHQWWGNLITSQDLTQFWLNEGVTTFMVAAWKEHRWGRAAYDRELAMLRNRVDSASQAGVDRPLASEVAYPTLSARRAIQYSKGALFMDQLRQRLGEDGFWRALKSYTQVHAGGTVDSRAFQKAFEKSSGQDLSPLFNAWVYGQARTGH